ncbi:MAG: hypothetical protein CL930_11200, partial [Deltaproteobacteria bacterium]|nr:hypothetical protein [Deltaproteobacteria bacterium]
GDAPDVPDSVVSAPLCDETGQIALADCTSSRVGWFSEGSQEGGSCELHTSDSVFGTAGIIESIRAKLNKQTSETKQEPTELPESEDKRRRWRRKRRD